MRQRKAPSAESLGSRIPLTPVDFPELDRSSTSDRGCKSQVGDGLSAGLQFLRQGPKGPSTSLKGSCSWRGKDGNASSGLGSGELKPSSPQDPRGSKLAYEER